MINGKDEMEIGVENGIDFCTVTCFSSRIRREILIMRRRGSETKDASFAMKACLRPKR